MAYTHMHIATISVYTGLNLDEKVGKPNPYILLLPYCSLSKSGGPPSLET